MKKKEIIVLSISIIGLITVSLYQTLATDITMNKVNSTDADLSYTFDITDQTGKVVNVASGATKILDVFVTNPNNGTIKYGIAYTPSSVKTNDITIAQLSTSKDAVSGLINKDERKQITLIIINNGTSDITLSLVSVTGYEHGGDLIVLDNHTLITESYEIEEPFEPVNAAGYIESLLPSNSKTMNNDDPDHNVRYMGKDPNNYVSFNNELWRIIGVFDVKSSEDGINEKRLKIIRNESIGEKTWDSAMFNNWSTSSLQTYLNKDYYNTLNADVKKIIDNTYWNLGGSLTNNDVTASKFYEKERSTIVYGSNRPYWVGKIGLMYPSDYGYATSGGNTTNRSRCLARELYNWHLSGYVYCLDNVYLYKNNLEQWMLTSYVDSQYYVFVIRSEGRVVSQGTNRSGYSVFPVLYLKSTVQITGGDGTSGNPYILG